MKESNYRRNTCRLCSSKNLKLVLKLEPTALADAYIPTELRKEKQSTYPLDLDLCTDCGFSQLRDIIHPEVIYIDYIYETKSSLGLVDHFERYADSVTSRLRPPKESLGTDIGSNDGTLLRAFKQQGLRVLGIDPAREIARVATESGVETLAEFFTPELGERIRKKYGPATIVTANNIFANVDDLGKMTEAIRSLLTSDGVFIFESFYLADLIENMVFDFIYHEHLSYFSAKPLASFFRHHGMELIDAERVPTKGGSLRYTAQLAGGPRKVSRAVSELIASETDRGLHTIEAFGAFAARITAAKNELLKLLGELKATGKKVDGYGASATTTTLLYHFELGDAVGCIYDDYRSKQGLFSPGYHIPVLAPEDIYERKPHYILNFAWRYSDSIIEKHRKYLEQGGQFIIPLPQVVMIP